MDKLTLAGLEATLEEYTRPAGPNEGIPTLNMISRPFEQLQAAAENLAAALRARLLDAVEVTLEPGVGRVGGGALPMGDLPGPRVAVHPKHMSAGRLEQALRQGNPPIIALVKEDALLMDPRTLLHDQASLIPDLIAAALQG
jgi:L-seryl-tRNA(Ser) seleniumtransferase